MSYDISLEKDGVPVDVPMHQHGAIIAVDGLLNAVMTITYNYSGHFARVLDPEQGIRWLYGKTGAQTLLRLEDAIAALKGDVSDDYWEPTEGNARRALTVLAQWAKLHPDATWRGD